MRKYIFILLVLCASTLTNAQLTKVLQLDGFYYPSLFGTYSCGISGNPCISVSSKQYLNGQYISNQYMDYSVQNLINNCFLYEIHIDANNTGHIEKYDENYSLIKDDIIVTNIPQYDNYFITKNSSSMTTTMYITSKVFNDDDNYEILLLYTLDDNDATASMSYQEKCSIQHRLILVDKNGSILHDFGMAFNFVINTCLISYNGKWFWVLNKDIYNLETSQTEYKTEIYQISKQSPQGLTQVSAQHMPAYPNPTSSQLNIPIGAQNGMCQVNIYDMNGHLIETKMGNDNGEVVNVNVSNYPAGNYIYQNGSNAGQFIKQ